MRRKSFSDMDCSVAQCLEAVGEWWSMLIVRDAFLGVSRFDEFQESLGIARNILQQRLGKLVEYEVLQKKPYSLRPPRFEYMLTKKGRDLWPVLTAMRQWGDIYAAPGGPPLEIRHLGCDELAKAIWTCACCGVPLESNQVEIVKNRGPVDPAISPPGPSPHYVE